MFRNLVAGSAARSVAHNVARRSTNLTARRYNSTEITNQLSTFETVSTATSEMVARSWYWPPDVIQTALETCHLYTGMPWWATIAAVTVATRVLLFPLYYKSSEMAARTSHVKPQLDEISKKMMEPQEDNLALQRIMMQRKKLLADHGIKNRYLAAPLLQIPLALGFFSGLRHMCNVPTEGLATQGLWWFTDLTAADPYLGLQCFTAAVFVGFAQMGAGESGAQQMSPNMKKVMTFIPLASIPATMGLSSGVVWYFAINGLCSVLQSMLLKNQWFRQKMNMTSVKIWPVDEKKASQGFVESMREQYKNAMDQAERKAEMDKKNAESIEKAKEMKANKTVKIQRRK